MLERINSYFNNYLNLVKFAHTIFALPFAFIGFTIGVKFLAVEKSATEWGVLALCVLICMVSARNAAMGFNRFLDRDIDKKNPRTANREIPAGILSAKSVLLFVIINAIIFIITSFFINPLCGWLSFIALFIILGYSAVKRFSWLCHFILGLGLSVAPTGAFLAVNGSFLVEGEICYPPLILSGVVVLWVGAFDILYALADEEFDKEHKLHSIPVSLGRKNAMFLSGALHFIIIPLLGLFYYLLPFSSNWLFIVGWALFSMLLIFQHSIVTPTNLKRLNAAFFTTNGIASIIFALFTVLALIL